MNSAVRTSTGVAPRAFEGRNETAAKLSVETRATKPRAVPELEVGHDVRRAIKTDKTREPGPNWSSELHQVEAVEETELGKKCKTAGYEQPVFRHELQKADAVEFAPGV